MSKLYHGRQAIENVTLQQNDKRTFNEVVPVYSSTTAVSTLTKRAIQVTKAGAKSEPQGPPKCLRTTLKKANSSLSINVTSHVNPRGTELEIADTRPQAPGRAALPTLSQRNLKKQQSPVFFICV